MKQVIYTILLLSMMDLNAQNPYYDIPNQINGCLTNETLVEIDTTVMPIILYDSLAIMFEENDCNILAGVNDDSDGDGIFDVIEGCTDRDGDGIPNHLDTDSDGDGIPDATETNADSDGDNIPNYLDMDSDGDGIRDGIEGSVDSDSDGIPNYLDTDSDEDGIPDVTEGTADTDGDGIPNYLDEDSDGDGISDEEEGTDDDDSDGLPNYLDTDSNNDGIPDNHYRRVYWLHGYQGNDESWKPVAEDVGFHSTDFEGRFKVASQRLDYHPNEKTLEGAAEDVINEMNANSDLTENTQADFIIAHSMGGLVARKMGMNYKSDGTPLYNGLITFGTPHQGAYVADQYAYNSEIIVSLLVDICEAFVEDEINSSDNFLANALTFLGKGDNVAGFVCNQVAGFGIPPLIDFLTSGVEPELTIAGVQSLPPMATDHNAVFYGEEIDTLDSLFPRFVGAMKDNGEELYPHHNDADEIGIAYMDSLITANSYNWAGNTIYNNKGAIYSQLHYIWEDLIGSSEIVLFEEAICRCYNYDFNGELYLEWSGLCLENPDPNPWLNCAEYSSWWSVDITKRASDGFNIS